MKVPMDKDLVKNAMRCMAVCDAVGNVFEFEKKETFSQKDILEYANFGKLEITDDSQMTLFGFESIISSCDITHAYFDWYLTQTEKYEKFVKENGELPSSLLISRQDMWKYQAPGYTCMTALEELTDCGGRPSNDSKGCGAVMRLLPMMLIDSILDRHSWMRQSIAVTHDHPECIHAAKDLEMSYMGFNINRLGESIEEYGEGWTAQSCVDMAIWAVNNAKDFDDLLVKSIWHDGDSDSVAAVAGSIWGMLGRECKYYDRVVERDSIEFILSQF